MGDPSTKHQYQGQGSGAIRSALVGIAAAVCILPTGKMNEWVTLRSLADLYREFGSKPALTDPGFNDWWNLYMALKNAVVNGKSYLTLYVYRTAHYTDYTDPSTLTAVKGSYSFLDDDSSATLKLEDVSPRADVFAGKIVASDLDSSAMFDIEIYVDGVLYDSCRNVNMTIGDVNYVVTRVGSNRKWKAVDLGEGTLPAVTASAQDFTGGSGGTASLLYTSLIGTKHATGNTGLHALSEFGPLEKPEHVMIPHKFSAATDERLLMKALEDFCYSNGYIPVRRTPEGFTRTQVKDFMMATGDYAGLGAFGNDIGGPIPCWPWGTPPELMTEQVASTGLRPRVSPEGGKIAALSRAVGIKGIEEAAAGYGGYGDSGFAELERKTNTDDSELLDPIGVQVIRSDLGNIFWGHCTMSTDPAFVDETLRRIDNYLIRSIDEATRQDLHRKGSPIRLRSIERRIRAFLRNFFNQHPDAFRYDTFEQAVEVDVVGQNDVESADYANGKIYSRWVIRPARSIHDIVHRYSHESLRTESGVEG